MIRAKKYSQFLNFILISFIAALFFACGGESRKTQKESTEEVESDLSRIRETGILKVVIDYNSTNYFVYRGKPMGYQYELVMKLCDDLEVKPEITVSNNMAETFEGLKSGRFDLVAKNLTVTRTRGQEVAFTKPLKQTRQVIVQRKPSKDTPDSLYLKTTLELAGKKIHVQQNTTYYRRLAHLSEEIGHPVEIVEDSVNGVEQLVAMVARGEINYTVCDENVALLNQSYYPNLDVSLKISFPQNIAWAVRKDSDEWKEFLDRWIVQVKKTREYKQIYHQYFCKSANCRPVQQSLSQHFGWKDFSVRSHCKTTGRKTRLGLAAYFFHHVSRVAV